MATTGTGQRQDLNWFQNAQTPAGVLPVLNKAMEGMRFLLQKNLDGKNMKQYGVMPYNLDSARFEVFGLTLTSNDPAPLSISWAACEVYVNRNAYDVAAGSTSAAFVYWHVGDAAFSTSATAPVLASDEILIARNIAGTAHEAWNHLAPQSVGAAFLEEASIGSAQIGVAAIGSAHIQTAAITSVHIAEGTIITADIGTAAIQTYHLGTGCVTSIKIGTAEVQSGNVANLAVGTAHLDTASVTNAKIGALAVGTAQLDTASVTAIKIGTAAVGSAQIANLAVGTAHLDTASVTNAKVDVLDAGKITTGYLSADRIDVHVLTVDKLVIKAPHLSGDTWTNNSPSADKAAWNAHSLEYNGTTYTIPAGDTPSNLLTLNQAGVETDTTGFNKLGASTTIARSTAEYWQGAASLKVDTLADGTYRGFSTSVATVTAGLLYTFAVYLKGSGTVRLGVALTATGAWKVASSNITLTSTWTRYTLGYTMAAGETTLSCQVATPTSQAITFYADALCLTRGTGAAGYIAPGAACKWVYWVNAASVYSASATFPTLAANDYLIAVNNTGTHDIALGKVALQSIDTSTLADDAVNGDKIAALAVGTAHIDTAAITNAKIGALQVGTANLDTASVTSAKIGALAVLTANIDTAAITNAKINDITANKITVSDGTPLASSDTYTKITSSGLEVWDNAGTPVKRVHCGQYTTGSFGLKVVAPGGATTILDESGILQTWQQTAEDNVGASANPLVMDVYLAAVATVVAAKLRIRLKAFRTYSSTASSDGGHTVSYNGNVEAGGGHNHTVEGTTSVESGDPHSHTWNDLSSTDGDHAHDMDHSHSISNHTHALTYGIYTSTTATGVTVTINGTDRTTALGGPFTTDQAALDITAYMVANQWNTVQLGSTALGRIHATVYMKTFETA